MIHYFSDCPKVGDDDAPRWSDDPNRATCVFCLYQAKIHRRPMPGRGGPDE